MKKSEYSIIGFIVGAIIGVLSGLGVMSQIKKSQRDIALPIVLIISGVAFAAGGATYGYNIGKVEEREIELGLDKKEEGYFKDGRYWVGYTKWKHPSTCEEFELLTARSNMGVNVTALNKKTIINHGVTGADKQTIPRLHQQARDTVFKNFKEHGTWKGEYL